MVANHLFFSRMTNVREVLLRLFSRGVILKSQKEKLVRMKTEEGTEKIIWILYENILNDIYKNYIMKEYIIRISSTSIVLFFLLSYKQFFRDVKLLISPFCRINNFTLHMMDNKGALFRVFQCNNR